MSLHSRPSLGVIGRVSLNDESRASLNAAENILQDLPEEDFRGRSSAARAKLQNRGSGGANPLLGNLLSEDDDEALAAGGRGSAASSSHLGGGSGSGSGRESSRLGGGSAADPTANPSTLEEQSWTTRCVYALLRLRWRDKVFDRAQPMAPQMYLFHNVGLYCHYAGIGFAYGIAGMALNFCFYVYEGDDNVCANSPSLVFLPWGFKIFYAMITDRWRPFGSRRRVWMVIGWAGGIACTVMLALIGEPSEINTGIWLGLSIATQAFLMIADVPADG